MVCQICQIVKVICKGRRRRVKNSFYGKFSKSDHCLNHEYMYHMQLVIIRCRANQARLAGIFNRRKRKRSHGFVQIRDIWVNKERGSYSQKAGTRMKRNILWFIIWGTNRKSCFCFMSRQINLHVRDHRKLAICQNVSKPHNSLSRQSRKCTVYFLSPCLCNYKFK